MNQRQRDLVLEHIEHVEHTAWTAPRGALTHEELVAVGHLALVECALRFEQERGTVFWAWAYRRIRGAMFDAVRKWTHYDHGSGARPPRNISLAEPAGWDEDGEGLTLEDRLADARQIDRESIMDFWAAIGCLTEHQRETLIRNTLGGEPLAKIGDSHGLSEARESQVCSAARRLVRSKMKE